MASTTPITPLTPYNYTYQAIPSAFVFSLLPHFYYTGCLLLATRNSMSVAHPRTNLDAWKSKLPQELWNHLTRARGAHLNSMEVFPLFAAAMVAGNVAGMDVKEMNSTVWSFFLARTVYMGLYMGIKSDTLAYARSGVYGWSISIPILALWRAGQVAAAKDV